MGYFGFDFEAMVIWVGAAMLVLAVLEGVWLAHTQRVGPYSWRETACSLGDFVLRNIVHVFLGVSIAAPLLALAWTHRIHTVEHFTWANFLVLMVAVEFLYYVQHLCQHKVRWLWINHFVHHSPQHIYFSTAVRVGISGKLIGNYAFFAPLLFVGYSIEVVTIALAINFIYQFGIHSEYIPKLGPLEGILNTPSSHRVHHGRNLRYLDCNYGGITVFFDRLFGTYVPEADDEPVRYGLVHQVETLNPIALNLIQWRRLFSDLRSAGSVATAVQLLVRPPGWSPDPARDESVAALRSRAQSSASGVTV